MGAASRKTASAAGMGWLNRAPGAAALAVAGAEAVPGGWPPVLARMVVTLAQRSGEVLVRAVPVAVVAVDMTSVAAPVPIAVAVALPIAVAVAMIAGPILDDASAAIAEMDDHAAAAMV